MILLILLIGFKIFDILGVMENIGIITILDYSHNSITIGPSHTLGMTIRLSLFQLLIKFINFSLLQLFVFLRILSFFKIEIGFSS